MTACQKKDTCTSQIDREISSNISSSTLVEIIEFYQEIHVRTSYDDWNCFTWVDYENFQQENVVGSIKNELESSCVFMDLINHLEELSETEQNEILKFSKEGTILTFYIKKTK